MPSATPDIDAREASTRVRAHFEEVHGQFAVFAFRVHAASRSEGHWRVVCSFSPTGSAERVEYEVLVDARSGKIEQVEERAAPR